MRSRKTLGIVLVLLVALCVLAFVAVKDGGSKSEPKATGEKAPSGLTAIYHQKLSWTDCGASRCTWVKVPIDYEKPAGPTLRLKVKLRPADGGKPRGVLFINPGGPGGSGVDFLGSFSGSASRGLRESYDIVGFDPRGVGASTPLKCLNDKQLDVFANSDPDPDNTAEIAEFRKATVDLGDACQANSGELAAHVSTVEAAKDMDVMRALLGQKKFDYYGASYGTQLGATYATLFPKKVGRMVLDGAVDSSLSDEQQGIGQAEGFQRALSAYIADCIKSPTCPLGTDPVAAESKLSDFLQKLDQDPMKAANGRLLTEGGAFYGIAITLYDRSYWSLLTKELTAAFKGDPGFMLTLFDAYFERNEDGSYKSNSGQVIYAVRCLDSTDPSSLEEVEKSIPQFEKISPAFGRSMGWGALGCTDWPIKSANKQIPISAKGAAPIVVVGTTRDPATPYEWAQALAKQLESGVLLTREGDGHTGFHVGNECIDGIVDTYFVKGTVPKAGTECKPS